MWDNAKAQDQSEHRNVYALSTFQAGQWVEKVSGDFTKPGEPFVFRIHQDAGYITLPHTHPIDENITVVKGSWSLGMGRRFNRAALEPMDTGTFGTAPKNMAHFAWSKTETILQIHGIGPFASTVVEPVYELTDKGIFLLTSLLLPGNPTSSSPPDCFALKVNAKVRGEAGEGVVVGAQCSASARNGRAGSQLAGCVVACGQEARTPVSDRATFRGLTQFSADVRPSSPQVTENA